MQTPKQENRINVNATKALREAREKYNLIFERAPLGILVIDPETLKPIEFNEAAHEQLGYTREEFEKLSLSDYKATETPEETAAIVKKILRDGKYEWETKHRTKNGDIKDVVIIARAVDFSGKKLVQSIYRDVTDHKRIELALMDSEAKYRQLVEMAQEGIWAIDNSNITRYVNPKVMEMLGYAENEIIGKNISEFLEDHNEKLAQQKIQTCKEGRLEQCEFNFVRKDGSIIYANIAVSPIEDDEGTYSGTLLLIADLTERKKSQEALKESEAKYRSLFTNMIDGFVYGQIILDEKGEAVDFVFLDVNNNFEKLTGLKKEILGRKISEVIPDAIKTSPELIEASGRVALYGKDERFEFFFKPLNMWFAISAYSPKKGYFIALFNNITERKKAEEKLKESNAKLEIMNEKLQVVGGLTRHDARNKLTAVTGYSYLLKKKHADQNDITEGLTKIERAVNEITEIFNFARTYEQLGIEEPSLVDVEKTIDEASKLFPELNIKIKNECHGLSLLADSFLRQLFYNFIDNTRKHGKTATEIKVHFEKANDGNLMLIYEDNGLGVLLENKQYLFKEGFSTAGTSGYGLFLIKKMMETYGWKIRETGEPGKGARFEITIPATRKNGQANYTIAP